MHATAREVARRIRIQQIKADLEFHQSVRFLIDLLKWISYPIVGLLFLMFLITSTFYWLIPVLIICAINLVILSRLIRRLDDHLCLFGEKKKDVLPSN